MTFAYTKTKVISSGAARIAYGTYTNTDSGTGGSIDTGLAVVDNMQLTPKGSSVAGNAPVVNETLPGLAGDAVTIVTDADEVGTWMAIGR